MYTRSGSIENINQILATWFPSMIDRIILEDSRGGRTISALRISAGDASDRHGVLFVGGTHARELLNPDLLVDMTIGLLVSYLNGSDYVLGGRVWSANTVRIVMETLDIFILPNANPDGREYVFDVNRMWRKNRAPNAGTACVGVDLNRNFELLWGVETVATSSDPCSAVYFGPSAFSEPETRNVKRLLDDFDVECMVDVHSYSELILHPWGHAPNQTTDPSQQFSSTDMSGWDSLPADAPGYEEYITPLDLERFEKVGGAAAEAIKDVRGRVYVVQPGTDLYRTTGTTSDYAYSRHIADPDLRKVYAFTFETGYWQGTAEESFQPPFPEADRIAEEATSGLVSILHSCVCAIHLIGLDLFGDGEDETLMAMRAIRDEHLIQTGAGQAWTEMLDRHSAELIRLATADEGFRSIAGELIALTGTVLRSKVVDSEHSGEVRQLLGALETSDISNELRADLRRLHLLTRQLQERSVDEVLGVLKRVRPHGRGSVPGSKHPEGESGS